MGREIAISPDRSHDGKAMASLPEQQRAFVSRLMELGPTKKAAAKAAKDVGYSPLNGYKLMRDERILAAIREEATKRLAGAALTGVNVLIEIAQDRHHKDQFKAAKHLAGINGFTTEQRIVVEHAHYDTKEKIREIRAIAAELGLDADLLLGRAGIVEPDAIDAEFTEARDSPVWTASQE